MSRTRDALECAIEMLRESTSYAHKSGDADRINEIMREETMAMRALRVELSVARKWRKEIIEMRGGMK